MKFPGFIGGSYQSQAYTADQQRTVNWFPEKLQAEGSTAQFALYPTPGVAQLSSTTSNPGRAHLYMAGREFAVIGTIFCEIYQTGAITTRGTVTIDSTPATISSNGDVGGQLFITSGGNGYVYDLAANTLTQIAALVGKATQGDYIDGYFLSLDATSSTLYISALADGATWSPGTDFAQRSMAADPWKAMKVLNRLVWLFGETTTEVWYDTGGTFPFAPHPSGVIAYGIAAPYSAVTVGNAMMWLGQAATGRLCVLSATGFTPTVISHYPLETEMRGYADLSTAIGDTYSDSGHTFYLLHFDRDDRTWAFDAETQLWSERGTWVPANMKFSSWRPRYYARAFGQHRMLDSATGALYRVGSDLLTDVDDMAIRRFRRAPALMDENKRLFYSSFELDIEPGVGNTVDPGSDPQVMMRFSDDGGKNWSTERQASVGKVGEYSKRVNWSRLGAARRRVFEVSVSDPVPYRVTGAYLTVEKEEAAGG